MRASLFQRVFGAPKSLWLAVPGLVFLIVFFVVPVVRLLLLSTQDATGGLTTEYYGRIFSTDVYFRVLLITFKISAMTAVLSVMLGYPLAYWLSRMPNNTRERLVLLVLVPFWTSYLVKTFAWMIVLGRNGVINKILLGTGITDQPLSMLHNEFSVMVGMVHAMMPLAILIMLPVMNNIDTRLTQAAGTLGAAAGQVFWRIYFQLSLPGVAAAGLLTFISSLGFFITPALLGGRRETMLAQIIITQVLELMNWAFAGVLSALILVATLITCWLYDRLFGMSSLAGEHTETGGAGFARNVGVAILGWLGTISVFVGNQIGRVFNHKAIRAGLPVYSSAILIFLVAPALVLVPIAFTSSQFLDFPPPGYSLRWFETYFSSSVWLSATVRSFGVALATAIIATFIGGLAALAIAKSQSRWRGALFAFFLAPMIVPRIVVAVGLFYLFAQMGLVATNVGLIIGHTVLALPFAFVAVSAVLKNYDWRLDQAAAILGANRFNTITQVTVPLVKGGLIAAFLFAFITSFDELTIAIFVSGGVKTTLPKQMWDDIILQLNPTLAAVSVVVFVVVTVLLLIAERLRRAP